MNRSTEDRMIDAELKPAAVAPLGRPLSTSASFTPHFADDRILLDQVERILHSEELRGSEVLRRLLRFLSDKTISGDADELKEYIVAIDGLGKPSSYDPRHNSAVRLQIGRLRQKLADYYRTEGHDDPVIIDVPKGRFKLRYEHREGFAPEAAAGARQSQAPFEPIEHSRKWGFERLTLGLPLIASTLAGVAFAIVATAAYYWIKPAPTKATTVSYTPVWNADTEDLWRPFIATSRPLIVAIEDPLFVELDGKKGVYYRDKTLNAWKDVTSSRTVEALRGALKSPDIQPSRYYTAFGEVNASFVIAQLLGSHVQNLSVVKTSNLSLQQVADNNVLFVGVQNLFFNEETHAMPMEAQLEPLLDGVRNVHPGPNEPAIFLDEYSTAPAEEGTAYALITHLPGPLGDNDVESFTSSRSAGYVAAVKSFTDPIFVRSLVAKLKQANGGQMPRYYQVLLRVRFKDEVPTEITYVLARVLHQGK